MDWPEAYELATRIVLGRGHCGIDDCCGEIAEDERQEIVDLATELVAQSQGD